LNRRPDACLCQTTHPWSHGNQFTNGAPCPKATSYGAKPAAFDISQVRLEAGVSQKLHALYRVGRKELDLMIERGAEPRSLGLKQIIDLGKNMETISRAKSRCEACA